MQNLLGSALDQHIRSLRQHLLEVSTCLGAALRAISNIIFITVDNIEVVLDPQVKDILIHEAPLHMYKLVHSIQA